MKFLKQLFGIAANKLNEKSAKNRSVKIKNSFLDTASLSGKEKNSNYLEKKEHLNKNFSKNKVLKEWTVFDLNGNLWTLPVNEELLKCAQSVNSNLTSLNFAHEKRINDYLVHFERNLAVFFFLANLGFLILKLRNSNQLRTRDFSIYSNNQQSTEVEKITMNSTLTPEQARFYNLSNFKVAALLGNKFLFKYLFEIGQTKKINEKQAFLLLHNPLNDQESFVRQPKALLTCTHINQLTCLFFQKTWPKELFGRDNYTTNDSIQHLKSIRETFGLYFYEAFSFYNEQLGVQKSSLISSLKPLADSYYTYVKNRVFSAQTIAKLKKRNFPVSVEKTDWEEMPIEMQLPEHFFFLKRKMSGFFDEQVVNWSFEERCFLQPLLLYSQKATEDPLCKKAFMLLKADVSYFNEKNYGKAINKK